MKEQSPSPGKRRKPGRFLWKAFRILAVLCLVCVGLSVLYAHALTLYFVRKALPKAEVRIESVELHGLTGVVAENVSIWDKTGTRQLLTIERIRIDYKLWDLARKRLEGIRIDNLSIVAGPGFSEALVSTSEGKGGGAGWSIGTLSCPYGLFYVTGFESAPTMSGKFCLEWKEARFANDDAVRQITAWDINVFTTHPERLDILDLYLASIDFRLDGLGKREVLAVDLQGGNLTIGNGLRQLANASGAREDTEKTEAGWTIRSLNIQAIEARIANLPGNAPDMRFTLTTKLQDVSLQGAASELQTREHEFEIADFNVYSPRDPSRKVVSLRSVFVRFTIAGLLNSEIAQVRIVRPTIYVSEDLFWYMDQAQQEQEQDDDNTEDKPNGWTVRNFTVYFGRLVLAAGETEQVGLPLNFETAAQNVAIGNLASLRLRATLFVPKQDIDLPDYEVRMDALSGDLRFAYPQEKGVNNLVNVLKLGQLRWKQFKGRDLWLSVTFDLGGVHGEFGGHAYRGYLSGGFDFFFQGSSPWTGWLAGTRMDCAQITDILAPQNFRMSGPLTFLVQVNGRAREIERVHGTYAMTGPGSVRITKLDALLAEIPDQWSALKQSAARIGMEVLKDFDFTKANGDFWFAGGRGRGNLHLSGDTGSRNFDIVLHP